MPSAPTAGTTPTAESEKSEAVGDPSYTQPMTPRDQVVGEGARVDRDQQWLRGTKPPKLAARSRAALRVVDLFAGCGGMTLGMAEAARRARKGLDVRLALDIDVPSLRTFARNIPCSRALAADVRQLFDGEIGAPSTAQERRVAHALGSVDVLLGGPPCQGHSDLNNHTRRRDPKNALYVRMARAAEVLTPSVVIVENVPPVVWDSRHVVGTTTLALEKRGYRSAGAVVDVVRAGVPQRRKRYLLVASRTESIDPVLLLEELTTGSCVPRTVQWAVGDLVGVASDLPMDHHSSMSAENRRRAEYLFANGLFDLPNGERPRCHRDGNHTYVSVYGRLRWDQPAQTITTGFTSMGQGRYIHPAEPRTITPHEAARLQTFPDWFDWGTSSRTGLKTMIGNAVPPILMIELGRLVLRNLLPGVHR